MYPINIYNEIETLFWNVPVLMFVPAASTTSITRLTSGKHIGFNELIVL